MDAHEDYNQEEEDRMIEENAADSKTEGSIDASSLEPVEGETRDVSDLQSDAQEAEDQLTEENAADSKTEGSVDESSSEPVEGETRDVSDLQSDAQEAEDQLTEENAADSKAEGSVDESSLEPVEGETRDISDLQSDAQEPEDQRAWFVIHCYSGYENKVRYNLEQRIETMGMKDKIFDVVIPTQEEIEVKDGKRRVVERHVFPGYVLVNMILTEESWYVVRNTPGVTGFVGMGIQPTPLRPEEVSQILRRMEAEAPHIKVTFKVGERVRIVDGPFNDFRGTVSEIDMERAKVRVMVNFFGRETPVELDFLQVEKA